MRFCILDSSLFLTLSKQDILMLSQYSDCSVVSPNNHTYYIGVLKPDEVNIRIPEDFKHNDNGVLRPVDVKVSIKIDDLLGLLIGEIITIDNDYDGRLHITSEEFFDAFIERSNIPVKQVVSRVSSDSVN